MQTYANLCLFAALGAYCFTDTGSEKFGKGLKFVALALVAGFVVLEGVALIA